MCFAFFPNKSSCPSHPTEARRGEDGCQLQSRTTVELCRSFWTTSPVNCATKTTSHTLRRRQRRMTSAGDVIGPYRIPDVHKAALRPAVDVALPRAAQPLDPPPSSHPPPAPSQAYPHLSWQIKKTPKDPNNNNNNNNKNNRIQQNRGSKTMKSMKNSFRRISVPRVRFRRTHVCGGEK